MSSSSNKQVNNVKGSESYGGNQPSAAGSVFTLNKPGTSIKSPVEANFDDLQELIGSDEASNSCRMMANLPKVDTGTFAPLLGTKFFCFHPSNFDAVSEEINTYLSCPVSNVNFDFDPVAHVWKCNVMIDFDTAVFQISLYEISTKDKIFVKFHRMSGAPNVFSASVERFSRSTYVAHELKAVDPTDLSESNIDTEPAELSVSKKRKGAFRALPLPLSVRQKPTSASVFISYCDVFNIWAQSDVTECLASILSSMPKMWKDLSHFYKAVEDMTNTSPNATGELIAMFESMNKIYKSLFAITIGAFLALTAETAVEPVSLLAINAVQVVAHQPMAVEEAGDSRYDFLDYEDEEVDGSAGFGDDTYYGKSYTDHREKVTMDVAKSGYRSMAVHLMTGQESAVAPMGVDNLKVETSSPEMFTVNVGKQATPAAILNEVSALYECLMSGATTSDNTPAENHHYTDMLSNRSCQDLSRILFLSMSCICDQFRAAEAQAAAPAVKCSLNVSNYLTQVVKINREFVQTVADLVAQDKARKAAQPGQTFERYNSKDIAGCAKLLQSYIL